MNTSTCIDSSSMNYYEFVCQEYKRGRWNDIKKFQDLEEASEFTHQRAIRTLELTRLIRVDVSPIKVYLYAR